MSITENNRRKRMPSLCCVAWIALIGVLSAYYGWQSVTFARKVRVFETKIDTGILEGDAVLLLGTPTTWICDLPAPGGRSFDVVTYKGRLYFRRDLVLFFDPMTKKLIRKTRGVRQS